MCAIDKSVDMMSFLPDLRFVSSMVAKSKNSTQVQLTPVKIDKTIEDTKMLSPWRVTSIRNLFVREDRKQSQLATRDVLIQLPHDGDSVGGIGSSTLRARGYSSASESQGGMESMDGSQTVMSSINRVDRSNSNASADSIGVAPTSMQSFTSTSDNYTHTNLDRVRSNKRRNGKGSYASNWTYTSIRELTKQR